jgi:hypothetical protein
MVNGRVAEEELVEKAVSKAAAMAFKCFKGLTPLPTNNNRAGRVMHACTRRPVTTVRA